MDWEGYDPEGRCWVPSQTFCDCTLKDFFRTLPVPLVETPGGVHWEGKGGLKKSTEMMKGPSLSAGETTS